ncbi:hypothetical protein [Streptomyces sp. NPDC054838]
MGGTQDRQPSSGRGPGGAEPASQIPAGQDPVHPGEPAGRRGTDPEALRRRAGGVPDEEDHLDGYEEQ